LRQNGIIKRGAIMKLNKDIENVYSLQDYGKKESIAGVSLIELKRFVDDGGSFSELLRLDAGAAEGLNLPIRQINYTEMHPATVKAFHVHRQQTDIWYVPPSDRLLLILVDVRADSPTQGNMLRLVLGDGTSRLVVIPSGIAHGCKNLSQRDVRVIYFMDQNFDPDPQGCDEGRLPWDHWGKDIWDVTPG